MGHRKEEWRQLGQATVCPGCRCLLAADAFYRNSSRPSGLSSYCKPCTTEKNKRANQFRRAVHRDSHLTPAEWNAKKRVGQRQRYERWKLADPERARAVGRAHASNRRTTLSRSGGSASRQTRQWRWEYYGGRCYLCGGAAEEMDHVIPVNSGGTGWPANLRPICHTCNRRKSDRSLNAILAWANTSTTPTTG